MLSVFSGVFAFCRAIVVCQTGPLRDDRRHITIYARRLTQLGVVHLLGDVVVEDVLQIVASLGGPFRPKRFHCS